MSNTKEKHKSVLQTLNERGVSLQKLHDSHELARPLAELILQSDKTVAAMNEPWDFKSIAKLSEESFCIFSFPELWLDGQKGARMAKCDFSERLVWWLDYEIEGLILFVNDGRKAFRSARIGDADYDFACRLRTEKKFYSATYDSAPEWSKRLFVNSKNLAAHSAFWHEPTTGEAYDEMRAIRRCAVLRESDFSFAIAEANGKTEEQSTKLQTETLSTKERTTTLVMLGALLKELRVDVSAPTKAGDYIQGITGALDARVSTRTAQEYIKQIADAIERKKKDQA
jgi:hypothetical protein